MKDLNLVPGLSLCAAAMKRVSRNCQKPTQAIAEAIRGNMFVPQEGLQSLTPDIALSAFDTSPDKDFLDTCKRLAAHEPNIGKDVLLVTHREGIFDLYTQGAGGRWVHGTPPYCCIVLFEYSHSSQEWQCKHFDMSNVKQANARSRKVIKV